MKHIRRPLSFLLTLVMLVTSMGLGLTANALGDVSPQATVSVTFKANADGVTNMPETMVVNQGSAITVPPKSNDPVPTRSGYKFMGWSYSSDPTANPASDLVPGTSKTVTGAFTAYAVWRKLVTLTYDGNGTGVTNVPAAQTGYGEITISTQQPKRNEYTFKGWGQTAGATEAWKSEGDTIENFTADRTIYAVWKQYTLTFNANGGSGGPGTVKGGEVEFKESYEPTWSGHTFLGWATSSSATTPSAAYATGKKITLNSNLTVYAVWGTAYTLSFNANGGSGAPAALTGSSVTIPNTKPTRSGYVFLGWAANPSATAPSSSYEAGKTLTLTGNLNLYAVWTQYTLTYNANGGSGAPAQQGGSTVTISKTKPTKEGYNFGGWATSSTASSPSNDYAPGKSVDLTANVMLYAVWLASDENAVLFDKAGGIGGPRPVIHKTQYFVIPTAEPTRTGYDFMGWTNDSYNYADYFPNRYYKKVGGPVVLRAVWHEKNASATLSFNSNAGGDTVSNLPASQTSTTGKWTVSSTVPTRSGYTFLGWETSNKKSAVNPRYRGGDQVAAAGSTTLYAIWAPNSSTFYTVKFDANGGTGAPADKKHTGTFSPPLSIPARTGYRFLGWSKTRGQTTPDYFAGYYDYSDNFLKQATVTVYAVWEEHTIIFNANGGSGGPTSLTGSGTVTLPTTKPTKSGYEFVFWTKTKDSPTGACTAGGTYELNEDTTLYAYWMKTYTLTYNANGGSGAPAKQTGYHIVIPDTKPTRSGYTFNAWNTKSDGSGTSYQSGEDVYLSGNATLYATWKQYTLTYDANGGSNAPAAVKGGEVTVTTAKPTRSNYYFAGWATSASATAASTTYVANYKFTLNANFTLYAVWKQYTMSFDANGGNNAPASIKHGGQTDLTRSIPTRSGYTFLGWSTSSSGLGEWQPGERYSGSVDRTFYAIWQKQGQQLTLSFNSNTTDAVSGLPASIKSSSGTWIVPATKPTRSGYTFLGWANSGAKSGTRAIYAEGDLVRYGSNLTLYAIWVENSKTAYTLTFDANGGAGAPTPRSYVDSFHVPAQTPYRDGLWFLGWSESPGVTTPSYYAHFNTSGTMARNLTLYAIWGSASQATLLYNANGGVGGPTNQGGPLVGNPAISTDTPTRAGYTFIGWSEHPYGYSPDFFSGESYAIRHSRTLYAVWAKEDKFTLFYNLNGGTGSFPPVECDPYTYATIADGNPVRDGGYFRGWNPDPEAFYSLYMKGNKLQMTGNLILYAYYLDATAYSNNKYLRIVYDANGGVGGPSQQFVTTGKPFTISPLFPTRAGYRFDGWVSTSSSYSPGQEIAKAGNNDLMLTARWTQIPDCYLSFDANGGTGAPARVKNATSIPMDIPTRTGYTFVHWNTVNDDSGTVYERNAPITMLGNMTLYAIWEKDSSTVLYGDVDGVAGITEADASKILQYCVLPPAEQATFFTAEQLQAADVDGINGVNEADASLILQYCVMSPEEQATYKFPAQP